MIGALSWMTTDFLIFNGNRNQPRKRIDITIKAYCCFLKNNGLPRAKLIMNSINDSEHGWNYKELIHNVFYHKNQIEDYEKYFYFLTFPQSLEVHNLNLLYNACDIGINTGDSEGYGLVCFEQASVGVPQVVGNFGGLGDLFDDSCSILVEPCGHIYHDATLDGVGGRGWCVSYEAVADGIGEYFNDEEKRRLHGEACIKKFKDCHWDPLAEKLEWRDYSCCSNKHIPRDLKVVCGVDVPKQPPLHLLIAILVFVFMEQHTFSASATSVRRRDFLRRRRRDLLKRRPPRRDLRDLLRRRDFLLNVDIYIISIFYSVIILGAMFIAINSWNSNLHAYGILTQNPPYYHNFYNDEYSFHC